MLIYYKKGGKRMKYVKPKIVKVANGGKPVTANFAPPPVEVSKKKG